MNHNINIINDIINLYDLHKNDINKKQLQYYHLDNNKEYQPKEMTHPMFFDINEYDYKKPIKILSEYFNDSKYYENIYNKIKKINNTKPIYKIPEYSKLLDEYELDDLILQYIKCRPNVHLIFLFNEISKHVEKISNELYYEYPIYYLKEIKLNDIAYNKLLYNIYEDKPLTKRINNFKINNINKIGIIWIDNIDENKFKKFNNRIIEYINKILNDKINNDNIYITKYFYQMIELSQVILNKNSLIMLSYGKINLYDKSFLLFNTFRHWCYSNFSLLDMTRLIIYGSLLLYCIGIRDINNINGLLIPLKNKNQTELELEELINFNLTHKIPFIDLSIENSKYRPKKYNDEIKNFIKQFNTSFSEITIDPKYHWYYRGIKLYSFDFEIQKKIYNIQNSDSINDLIDIILLYFNYRLLLKDFIKMKNNKLILLHNNIKKNILNDSTFKLIKKKLNNYNLNISKNTLKQIL
jgi:hypothetical protein